METQEFVAFLTKKKINSDLFQKNEPQRWNELCTDFNALHPNSFVMQKLFVINQLRRRYTLLA